MYKELVFYLEACHSGSMFNKLLPNNISIYTTTAANPDESSYAEYCSYEAKVNGTLIDHALVMNIVLDSWKILTQDLVMN